jgi:hypothetical protein
MELMGSIFLFSAMNGQQGRAGLRRQQTRWDYDDTGLSVTLTEVLCEYVVLISRQSPKCDPDLCDMCPTSSPVELSFVYVL